MFDHVTKQQYIILQKQSDFVLLAGLIPGPD